MARKLSEAQKCNLERARQTKKAVDGTRRLIDQSNSSEALPEISYLKAKRISQKKLDHFSHKYRGAGVTINVLSQRLSMTHCDLLASEKAHERLKDTAISKITTQEKCLAAVEAALTRCEQQLPQSDETQDANHSQPNDAVDQGTSNQEVCLQMDVDTLPDASAVLQASNEGSAEEQGEETAMDED